MVLLTVNQAERYFCPYREGNCIPHECMAWKYADDNGGYCQMFDDSVPISECIEQKDEIPENKSKSEYPMPETIQLRIYGTIFVIEKPEHSISVMLSPTADAGDAFEKLVVHSDDIKSVETVIRAK